MKRVVHVNFFSDSLNIEYHQKVYEFDEIEAMMQTAKKIYRKKFETRIYPDAAISLQIMDLINYVSKSAFFKLEFFGADSVVPVDKIIEMFHELFPNFALVNIFTEYSNTVRIYYLELIPLYFDESGSKLMIDVRESAKQQNPMVKQTALAFYFEKELTRYIYELTGSTGESAIEPQLNKVEIDTLRHGDTQAIDLNLDKSAFLDKLALENYHLKLENQTLRETIIAFKSEYSREVPEKEIVRQPIFDYQLLLRTALSLKPAYNYYLKVNKKLDLEASLEKISDFSSERLDAKGLKREVDSIEIDALQQEAEWIDGRVKYVKTFSRQLIAVKILIDDLERLKLIGRYSEIIRKENIRLNALLDMRN